MTFARHTTSAKSHGRAEPSELSLALATCRSAFIGTGVISGMSNILMLTGAIFMLEIYDRVLPSRSVPTLVGSSCWRADCSRRSACST